MLSWPALEAARRVLAPRLPLLLRVAQQQDGQQTELLAGSVALSDVSLLAAWPEVFELRSGAVCCVLAEAQRTPVLAQVNLALHAAGRMRAWRHEPYPLLGPSGELLAVIERASARFWGALTFGAHCNGYVLGADGRPSHLWVARRALDKPTDPGMLDNLIGCGVPHGQTPRQALIREAWEEAGLLPEQLGSLQAGSVLNIACNIREGWQHEWLYAFDLALPAGLTPVNQDGEVAEHRLWPIAEALAFAASGQMTLDASLATLDFALRHALLPGAQALLLAPRLAALRVAPEVAARFDPPRPG
jgi:8-oxo-dGTP pyrophosphatase MutT (NUDIX family)